MRLFEACANNVLIQYYSHPIAQLYVILFFMIAVQYSVELFNPNFFIPTVYRTQLYMILFFTSAVQYSVELRVSLQRIHAFLATPEPPPPDHHVRCYIAKFE